MSRRLLVVAPAFPPHPSPASHRARWLTRYGPPSGWDVDVLTVSERDYDEPPDFDVLALVPDGTRITRVHATSSRLTRRVGISDLGLRSFRALRRALVERCTREPPDAIYIPGGPFYTFLLGAEMRRRFGVPYVLDYTDPWVWPIPTRLNKPWRKAYWSHLLARTLEPRAIRSASLVFGVSSPTVGAIRARYPHLPAERFGFAPYGFDAEDFAIARARGKPTTLWDGSDGLIHIAYVGVMWEEARESLSAIFAALGRLRADGERSAERVRMHFVGTTYDPRAKQGAVMPLAEAAGVAEAVTEHHARVPYATALSALTQADVLLAFGGSDPTYTSSKIFPTILARRPILAIYHEDSPVCDILRTAGVGDLITFNDARPVTTKVAAIAEVLARVVARAGAFEEPRLDRMSEFSSIHGVLGLLGALDRSIALEREASA